MLNFLRSEKFRSAARKVFWITVAWVIYTHFQFWHDASTLSYFNCTLDQHPWVIYQGSILSATVAGVVGGFVLVTAMDRWLRTKPYGQALLYIFLSYTVVWFFVTVIAISFYNVQETGQSIFQAPVGQELYEYLVEFDYLNAYVTWLFIVLATLVIMMVNDKYGPGVFRAFILGKYFHPKREERIFMFLDLRSSTAIAEQLGEERYFDFIKQVFSDATGSIIYNKGEIYQYVGDEIVVSWRVDRGVENANCIRCFFDIQSALRRKAPKYLELYGVVPEFKAGLHHGYVMAGEVGVVKRDIVYSGDVLNTTARIQAKCNEAGVNILLSQFLLDRLSLPPHLFQPQKIGDILLRGKQQKVMLYTV